MLRRWTREVEQIVTVMREASKKLGKMRLVAVGRGSVEAKELFREAFEGSNVEVVVRGILPAVEIAHEFESADVMLFLRGAITPTRGSAIAGIACGVPIVGNRNGEIGRPLMEAGIEWSFQQDRESLDSRARQSFERSSSLDGTARAKSRGAEELFFMGHNRRAILQGITLPRSEHLNRKALDTFACLKCSGALGIGSVVSADVPTGEIVEGLLQCETCHIQVPIVRRIPRFVSSESYASSFGFQWNRFDRLQVDSVMHNDLSRDRFYATTGWPSSLKGSAS